MQELDSGTPAHLDINSRWPLLPTAAYVAPLLQPARIAKEYAQLFEALDAALDTGGAPLARLTDYIGELVDEYEAKDKMPPAVTGAEALRYLMERDNLRQIDLPELGRGQK